MASYFSNTSHYPAFSELPAVSTDQSPNAQPPPISPPEATTWWLLAQIKENMTITQPTLIVTDRTGVDFALLFDDHTANLRGFKKGYTLAVPGARRTERAGVGKKAVVHVPADRTAEVKVVPGSLERVLELGVVLGSEGGGGKCAACGDEEGMLMKCTGCAVAAYCGKDCQVKAWGEMGHKLNCKVLRALQDVVI
ncbi:hypothetical protein F4777DRAFT_583907 [Nemania sp. FL0916]|nr:hypothetical protein F4777DRAFT_583907 [Nemania sp. FL0916]